MIDPSNHLLLTAVTLGAIALGLFVERTPMGRIFPAAVFCIVSGLILANIGIIPHAAPMYGIASDIFVPLAIPLFLFKADLRRIITEGGRTMIAFSVGALGTIAGGLIGFMVLDLGPLRDKLLGVFVATYTGGSMNMIAVAKTTGLDDATAMSAAVAADNVVSLSYLTLLTAFTALPLAHRLFAKSKGAHAIAADAVAPEEARIDTAKTDLWNIAMGLSLSAAICAISTFAANAAGHPSYAILILTFISVALANFFPKLLSKLTGDEAIGMLLFYFLFFVIGAAADISALTGTAFNMLLFGAIIVSVHTVFVFIGGWLFKLTIEEVAIGSNACVLGPATAAAMAGAMGWRALVTPGIVCGVFGYVIANFIGAGLAAIVAGG
ncbi:DUF819 domain-containing protein [Marinicaulis aureus]|uniref:DUF819 domain-containing protein n=1 Tax=Hyphococcus aureus TaxID=2666033 RepID=A0ABW1KW64_9PROT